MIKSHMHGFAVCAFRDLRILPVQRKNTEKKLRTQEQLPNSLRKIGSNPFQTAVGKELSFHLDTSYNKVTVKGVAASRVFFHLKAEAVRMGE